MDFELPATKEELQNLLREIDDYYRNYKGEYEEKPLEEPVLQKLSFTPSSEESVRRAVEAEFGEKTDAEAAEKTAEYEALCQKYDDLASAEDTETEKRLADAAAAYEEKLKKLEADAAKRGIARSSAYLSLRAALETEYEGEKAEIGRQAVSEVLNGGLPERYEIEFSEEHPGRAARMEGDAALLRRMLDNLIRNSIVHNPQGCRISVTVGAEDGRCVSTVTDDGVGMDAARLEALNREADVSSTQGGEHGLGLKLVRQIVKAHGGTVQFRQVAPHGLDICIVFPAYEIS